MKLKKIGIGSLSLILFIFGFLFIITFNNGISIGDTILNYIGLKAWSNDNQGTHYTIFYSLLFFVPSLIIGYKFKDNFSSKMGKVLSSVMLIIVVFSLFLSTNI